MDFGAFSSSLLSVLTITIVVLSCVVGVIMSMLSLSGTWAVLLAAIFAMTLDAPFPSFGVVLVFMGVAIALEVFEFFAGAWGVQKRGGSRKAGVAAVIGSLLGLFLGTLIPIPIVGSLLGMLLGGFGLVFLVEWNRLQRGDKAAHIAWGAVIARVAVIFLKVCASFGLSLYLLVGLFRS